jgi:hypothetical protein
MACSGIAKKYFYFGSRCSSVSIISDFGLDDRASQVRFPAEANNFSSSLCVQTGSGAHPASSTKGTGCHFPGGKARPGLDADHSPHLVPRPRMSRSYTPLPSSPPYVFWDCFIITSVQRKLFFDGTHPNVKVIIQLRDQLICMT